MKASFNDEGGKASKEKEEARGIRAMSLGG